jgi:hypothetical protein
MACVLRKWIVKIAQISLLTKIYIENKIIRCELMLLDLHEEKTKKVSEKI